MHFTVSLSATAEEAELTLRGKQVMIHTTPIPTPSPSPNPSPSPKPSPNLDPTPAPTLKQTLPLLLP